MANRRQGGVVVEAVEPRVLMSVVPTTITVSTQAGGAPAVLHAGQPLPVETVVATDAIGNPAAAGSIVTVSAAGTAVGGTTSAETVEGKATFSDLTLPAAGTYTLTFAAGAATATTTVTVLPAMLPATTAVTGVSPGRAAVDAAASFPNWKPGNHGAGTITYEITNLDVASVNVGDGADSGSKGGGGDGGAGLSAYLRSLYPARGSARIVDGQAAFPIPALKTAGHYLVTVSDGQGEADQSEFTVEGGPPVRIQFEGAPGVVDGTVSASVRAVDRFGNTTAAAAGTIVTLALAPHAPLRLPPALGGLITPTLGGPLTATIDSTGVATFAGLTVSTRFGEFRLRASAADLRPVVSTQFYPPW